MTGGSQKHEHDDEAGYTGTIRFSSYENGQTTLLAARADGKDVSQLGASPGKLHRLEFSPDGETVLFNLEKDGNWDIYRMNTDGTELVPLTRHPGKDRSPAWSPDGLKIAWQSDRSGRKQIHVMNADGTDQKQVTPDGSKIGFTSFRDDDFEIYIMDADGKNPLRLTRSPGRDFGGCWSPDGGRILFASNRDSGASRMGVAYEVYVVDADGGNSRRLTKSPARDSGAIWSPDGNAIAFVSEREGNKEIYLMKPDGTNKVNLTTGLAEDASPAWLPER
jgi:TolB protein